MRGLAATSHNQKFQEQLSSLSIHNVLRLFCINKHVNMKKLIEPTLINAKIFYKNEQVNM